MKIILMLLLVIPSYCFPGKKRTLPGDPSIYDESCMTQQPSPKTIQKRQWLERSYTPKGARRKKRGMLLSSHRSTPPMRRAINNLK